MNYGKSTCMTTREVKLKQAVLDYGYRPMMIDGGKIRLYGLGVAWCPGSLDPHVFGSMQAAAEYLIPIISRDGFQRRVST